jgi:hypothetical protein
MKKFGKFLGVLMAVILGAGIALAGSSYTVWTGSSSNSYQSAPNCTTTAVTNYYTVHVLDDNGSEVYSYNTQSTSYFSVGSGC